MNSDQRSFKDHLLITARGIAMGAADVIPGVSGGTIAFISGIYEELIDSLRSFDHIAVKVLFKQGPAAFWKHVNGTFLVFLFAGIGISIVSLAKLFTYLLETHPIQVWAFFFGLILASVWLVGKQITKWDIRTIIVLIGGAILAYYITVATPAKTPETWWFIILSGMIAICAMILPGISGSFILLLLGKYAFIIGSISDHDFKVLGLFAVGCGLGLLTFSHLLSWMFKHLHNITVALLTGFMVGSLNKVWPWKMATGWVVNMEGSEPIGEESVMPWNYFEDPQLSMALIFAVLGVGIIVGLEMIASKKQPA